MPSRLELPVPGAVLCALLLLPLLPLLAPSPAVAGAIDVEYQLTTTSSVSTPRLGSMTLRFHVGSGTTVSTGPVEIVQLAMGWFFFNTFASGGHSIGNGAWALVGFYAPPLPTNPTGLFDGTGALIGRQLLSTFFMTDCVTASAQACGYQRHQSTVSRGPLQLNFGSGVSSFTFSATEAYLGRFAPASAVLQVQGQEIGRTAVPEPATGWLVGIGALALTAVRLARRG